LYTQPIQLPNRKKLTVSSKMKVTEIIGVVIKFL
jgi:hypothetical protein